MASSPSITTFKIFLIFPSLKASRVNRISPGLSSTNNISIGFVLVKLLIMDSFLCLGIMFKHVWFLNTIYPILKNLQNQKKAIILILLFNFMDFFHADCQKSIQMD